MKKLAFALILCLSVAAALLVHSCQGKEPATLTGPITKIVDGDTVKIGPLSVRLAGIDAPEKAQPNGPEAMAYLASLCEGKQATATVIDSDMYGRAVAYVKVEGVTGWLSDRMVEAGWAHHYAEYSSDQTLADAQKLARSEKRGLWRRARPENPATYRARIKRKATSK